MSIETDELNARFLMQEIARAAIERDMAALDRIFDDDFTLTDPTGAVISKDEWLGDIASGALIIEGVESESFDIRPVGDTFRVKGRLRVASKSTKRSYAGTFDYLGVYTKHGDEWRLTLTSARRVAS